jgi:dTDP-4-dehydrorhamnose reductase
LSYSKGGILRVLVTGAKGMLGTDVCEVLRPGRDLFGYDVDDFDITDLQGTLAAVNDVAPDVVVHLAAFTQVDACEGEREEAFRVNALGAMNVARAARVVNAHLVYISTDYVFDGTKTQPYIETDEPHPINYYGLTKLCGEIYVKDLTLRHLIIRTSWLFGPNGSNFVDTIVGKAAAGKALRVVDDQHGCPTYTLDLARGIERVLEQRLEGTVHITNAGQTTWFGLARYAIEAAGIQAQIEAVSSREFRTKAQRPAYSVLASPVMEASGIAPLPSWQAAVRDHLLRKGMLKGSEAS